MSSPYADDHPDLIGWHDEMPNEDYHSSPGLSKSSLDLVSKSINHLVNRQEVRKETPAMVFGTAAHAAVLEPHVFADGYLRGPEADRRSKEWKAAEDTALENGRIIIEPADFDRVSMVTAAVNAVNDPAVKAIKDGAGMAEGSVFVKHPETGLLLKARPDYLLASAGVIVDLKTTKDASPEAFARSCGSFRYDIQAALYSDIMSWELSEVERDWTFVFIAAESQAPFNVAIYTLDHRTIEAARDTYNADIRKFVNWHEGYEEHVGYSASATEISIPRYFRRGA